MARTRQQNPWENDPVVEPQAAPINPREVVRRPDGSTYAVVRSEYTNETPTQLLNQGYQLDPATGSYARTVGTFQGNVASDEDLARQMEADRVRELELGALQSDQVSAAAGGAAPQIPFLDELAAATAGALTGTSYSDARGVQRDLSDYERQNYGTARNVGGVAGFASGLALPGSQFISGARGAAQLGRAGLVGSISGAAYGAGAADDGYASRLRGLAVGGVTGGLGGTALQAAGNGIAARLSSIASPPRATPPIAERVADLERLGIDPTLAGTGGPLTQRTAQTLAGNIATGGPIIRAAERTRGQTTDALERVAGSYGSADGRDAAGRVLRGAAEDGAQRLRQEGSAAYAPINALDSNPTPIPLTNAAASMQDSLSIFQTPELRDWFTRNATELSTLRDVLSRSDNQVTFGEARRLRSIVGSMLDDPQVFNSQSQSGLRSLYGSLSDDISEGARLLGGDDAANSLSRADSIYAANRSRADNVLKQFYQSRGGREVTDAEAYNRLLSAARTTGNRSSANMVRQIRDSVSPEEWGDIGGGIIRTLGGEGDQFSIAKFATEYEKLTPEARRIMFGGRGRETEFADLNALARVARQQERAGRFYNSSESGNTLGNLSGATALAGAAASGNVPVVAGIIGAGVMGNGLARILTSPGVARWAAGSTRTAVRDAEQLARRSDVFRDWWGVNRDAVIRAVAQNDNLPILPVQSAAEEQEPLP